MKREFQDLSDTEIQLRTLIYAIEVKDKWNKNHPRPLGEEYLQMCLLRAKDVANDLKIPLVEIDLNNYH